MTKNEKYDEIKKEVKRIEEFIEEIVYWLQNYLPIVYDILHMSFPSCRSRCSVANSIVNELGVVKGVQFICAVLEYSLSKEGKNET